MKSSEAVPPANPKDLIILVDHPVKFKGYAAAVGHPESVTPSVRSIGTLQSAVKEE